MSSSKKSSSKKSSSMSPSSAVSVKDLDELVVQSPRGASEAVIVESVDGPMVVVPNTENLLRVPVEGPMDSYTNSNARQQRLAMWRAREPVRVNISPRARWSSSSEGRRKKTRKFRQARMRDRPPTPRATVTYPRLRRPPVVPARERDWVRRNIPAYYIQRYREGIEGREGREGMDLSPISPSSADLRRYMEDSALWGDSSSSGPMHSPRTRSSTSRRSSSSRSPRRPMVRINPPRIGRVFMDKAPMIAPPPAGRPRTRNRQHGFQGDDNHRRYHREWRKTRKELNRQFGIRIPKGSSSSSSTSSSSSRHS